MSTFARFPPLLQNAIVSRLGWTSLRPVQELAGEAILEGRNAVVLAPTAGGKTEASMFPVLASLLAEPREGVGAVYVAPIKALLNNQEERLGLYTEMVGLRRFVWHGDVLDSARKRFLREPAELLMTTPESLEVMLLSPRVPVAKLFAHLRFLVVDEVHALSGTDRGAHLLSVFERVARFSVHDVQRIGLSATVGNPEAILGWLQGTSRRERALVKPQAPPTKRELAILHRGSTGELARDAARRAQGKKSLFFCQTRAMTEAVADHMAGQGIDVFVHHSSVSLEERRRAEERFQHGTNACIVATSTLELGIDVGDLDLVFQAGAPSTVSSFIQRMGRTGRRAGSVANTTFLCEEDEAVVQAIALVELARDGWVEPVRVESRCWPVFVHQLLALTLQFGGISRENAWTQLSRVPDFAGFAQEEFEALVQHLLAREYLFQAGGLVSFGARAEREFGRRNFLEMYAVFSSPVLYRVRTATGTEIGSVEQDFAERLVHEMSSFLLGGRAWLVDQVSHADREVRVSPAPRGTKPSWGGFVPQLLSYELWRRMRGVLTSDAEFPYLHTTAAARLSEKRDELGALLRRGSFAVQSDGAAVRWWTFAGGRVNYTLKFAVELLTGWKVVADNLVLRVEGDGLGVDPLRGHLKQLAGREFWIDAELQRRAPAPAPRAPPRLPPEQVPGRPARGSAGGVARRIPARSNPRAGGAPGGRGLSSRWSGLLHAEPAYGENTEAVLCTARAQCGCPTRKAFFRTRKSCGPTTLQ